METKKCGVCGETKNLNDFYVRCDNGEPRNTCKVCQREKEAANKKRKK